MFCVVWQYHNFSVILKNPPISGVHSDKRWKQSHNDFRVGPRLQQSTYQKREVGGISIQSDWWALQSTTVKTMKTHILNTYAQVYCGLSTEEALWLVSRRNITAAIHH